MNPASQSESAAAPPPKPKADASDELATLRARVAELEEQLSNYQKIEKSLMASRARWYSVVENSAEVVLQLDRDGLILFLHAEVPYTTEQVVGSVSYDYVAPEHKPTMKAAVDRVFQSGKPGYYEVRDLRDRWYGCRVIPLNRAGVVDSAATICTDITERKQQEKALRESEERLRLLTDQIPAILWTADRDLRFTSSRGAGLARLKLASNEVVGQTLYEFLETDDPEFPAVKAVRGALAGKSTRFEQPWAEHVYDCYVEPLRDADENLIGVLGVALDVTDRAAAQQSMLQVLELLEDKVRQRTAEIRSVNDSLMAERRLLRRLLELHDRDRQFIAYEIHDGLVQDMTGAVMRLSAALRYCTLAKQSAQKREQLDSPPADESEESLLECLETGHVNLATAIHLIQEAIDEARRLINGLRPPVLEAEGLVAALENLKAEVEHTTGLTIDLRCQVQFDRMAPALETAIYRVVQESLNNVARHSGSSRARVEMLQQNDTVHISVQDWGKGFDADHTPQKRYGLTGIKERARLLEGKAKIDSRPGEGTTIHVTLPLKDVLLPS